MKNKEKEKPQKPIVSDPVFCEKVFKASQPKDPKDKKLGNINGPMTQLIDLLASMNTKFLISSFFRIPKIIMKLQKGWKDHNASKPQSFSI